MSYREPVGDIATYKVSYIEDQETNQSGEICVWKDVCMHTYMYSE